MKPLFDLDRGDAIDHADHGGPGPTKAVQIPKWRAGEELPPFADPSMVPTLNGILDGSILVAPVEAGERRRAAALPPLTAVDAPS